MDGFKLHRFFYGLVHKISISKIIIRNNTGLTKSDYTVRE